jgi:drug/metabolite transporter (DMT)-like permease
MFNATDKWKSENSLAYLLLLTTTLCWGCNAVFARLAVGEVSPMLLVSIRWMATMLLLILFFGKNLFKEFKTIYAHWRYLFLMGTVGFSGFTTLFYLGAYSTTAVNIGIIQGAMPALVLLGSYLFFKTPVTFTQITGVSVTILGVIIVSSGGDLSRLTELIFNRGDLLLLVAVVLYAAYTLGLRKRPNLSSIGLFISLSIAAFVSSLPMAFLEASWNQLSWPTTRGWIIIVLIVLLPSFLSQICFIKSVELIGPGRAGVFVNLVPIFSSIFAVSYLGESFESYHGLALLLVFTGIFVFERFKPL